MDRRRGARGVPVGEFEFKGIAGRATLWGRDIDMVRTLSALGSEREILMSAGAAEAAGGEGLALPDLTLFEPRDMRECGSKRRWLARYAAIELSSDCPPGAPARHPDRDGRLTECQVATEPAQRSAILPRLRRIDAVH